jgi:trehalose 6-phosphate synthase
VRQFADHQTRELGAELVEGGGEEGVLSGEGGRRYRAIACPIGVDVAEVERLGRSAEARRQAAGLREGLHGGKLVVGVDRLDYTKGIPQRLRAFEAMLRDRPEYAKDRSVTFLQISAPSREEVPEYQTLRRSIERLAGHINGRFGDHDWTPLRYVNKTYNRRALAGFFARSAVCLITPLRDGLNLVAEEYVVAQDPADPGVLVLSRFAGAAEVLEGALNVNPYDVTGSAATLATALAMPLAERQERHAKLMTAIRANDITAWRKRFLAALDDGRVEAEASSTRAAA